MSSTGNVKLYYFNIKLNIKLVISFVFTEKLAESPVERVWKPNCKLNYI
jgi:hypothetical protein